MDIFDKKNEVKPTEGDIVANSKDDALYSTPFSGGKYLNIQSPATKQYDFEVSPRIKLSLVYIDGAEDTSSFTLSRFKADVAGTYQKDGEIKLSTFDLAKIRDFLAFLQSIDLKSVTERRLRLADASLELTEETKKQIKTLLSSPEGLMVVEEIIKSGAINSKDIINLGYRKDQLLIFNKLLTDGAAVATYRSEHEITTHGDEAVWQTFFKENQWIFGYGLKYQFLSLITDQPHYGGESVTGTGDQRGDFLLATEADRRFTVLVEIKTPKADLVGSEIRSGVHRVGTSLVDGVSQLQINCQTWETEGSRTEANRNLAIQDNYYTHEPRAILVIGHTRQLDNENKRKSFEIFRVNLKSPEILTFDELYMRAKYIVEHSA
jgi:hypothetical protein